MSLRDGRESREYVSATYTAGVLAGLLLLGMVPHGFAQPPAPLPVPVLTVRGTVESVDLRHTAFVLRVQTHTRLIAVTEDTDVSGLALAPPAADGALPVTVGERLTVGGFLQSDGMVLAGLLAPRIVRNYQPPAGMPDRLLFGTVSATSNKLRGRDIKLRDGDGVETKVKVGRGISITRAGRPISVHDLSVRDEIRVVGTQDGTDVQAQRIAVLPPETPPAPTVTPNHKPLTPGL